MRFKNSSSLLISKALWQEFAIAMSLGGALPGALGHEFGMYPSSTLRVGIHRERPVQRGRIVTTGSYTYGHITLSPCLHCTPAFLTQVYFHELVHAWLHQTHSEVYDSDDSCRVAERFADAGFRVIGGAMRDRNLCGSYSLPLETTLERLHDFRSLSRSLTELPASAVVAWRPPLLKRGSRRLEG